jgi:hypothetical protein
MDQEVQGSLEEKLILEAVDLFSEVNAMELSRL